MRTLLNEIWLEFGELLSAGISEETLKKGILRNSPKWQATKDPNDKRKRLVRYATLGESYKEAVRAELCGGLEPGEWIVMQQEQAKQNEGLERRAVLVDRIEDMCDVGYRSYLHLYRGLETRQQRRLARAAGVLTVLTSWYKVNNIPWKKSEPVKMVTDWMKQRRDDEFAMYLPENTTRLKEKVLAHGMEGKNLTEVIYLPRQGNENRVSHKNEMWWQSTAIALSTNGRNMTQSAITRKIGILASIDGKDAPSDSTVRAFLRETNFLTADKRMDLNNRHLHRHRASMPLQRAMNPEDCWEMDGTRVQLAPHMTKDGLKFLYVVVVRDVYSGAYLGYHFATSESGHAYRMALKMAVNFTGKVPYELRHDK